MGIVTATVRTVDDQAVPVPIDGVLVRVFDLADVFIASGTTGVVVPGSGEVNFSLNGSVGGVGYYVLLSKDGVSFPPAPTFPIAVTDPPSPPNEFEFEGHIGMVDQLVTISVRDADEVPVEDVRVRIFSVAGVFLTELNTDALGEATVVLEGSATPGTTYMIRMYKVGWTFTNGAVQLISVLDPVAPPSTNIFDIEAATATIPESSNPEVCLLSGYLTDVSGRPMLETTLRFTPIMDEPTARVSGFVFPGDPTVVDRNQLFDEAKATTDQNGYLEIPLPRRSIQNVHHHGFVLPGVPSYAQVYVPDSAGAKLEDVLFPYVASVDYSEDTMSMNVGDTEELDVSLEGSNDQPIEGFQPIHALVEFVSSDLNVATVELTTEGKLSISGIGVGSATITASRLAGTSAPRRPSIPALVATAIAVTVS